MRQPPQWLARRCDPFWSSSDRIAAAEHLGSLPSVPQTEKIYQQNILFCVHACTAAQPAPSEQHTQQELSCPGCSKSTAPTVKDRQTPQHATTHTRAQFCSCLTVNPTTQPSLTAQKSTHILPLPLLLPLHLQLCSAAQQQLKPCCLLQHTRTHKVLCVPAGQASACDATLTAAARPQATVL